MLSSELAAAPPQCQSHTSLFQNMPCYTSVYPCIRVRACGGHVEVLVCIDMAEAEGKQGVDDSCVALCCHLQQAQVLFHAMKFMVW